MLFFAGIFFLAVFAAWGSGIVVPQGSQLNVNSGKLNLELANNSGHVVNSGIISITTGEIKMNGNWVTSGAAAYLLSGSGTVDFSAAAGNQTITTGTNINDIFYNLTHSGAGTLELLARPVNIDGNFNNLAGTFKTNDLDMTVAGNWNNTSPAAEPFISGSATVFFDGGDQAISGETSFYNFSKLMVSNVSRTLTFPAGLEQKVVRLLRMKGFNGNNLLLRSSTDTSEAFLSLQSEGIQDISAVDVKDSNAVRGVRPLVARGASSPDHSDHDVWNNTNWEFGTVSIIWDGSKSTDWNDPQNWDHALVPGEGDTATIINGPTIPYQPTLTLVSTMTGMAVENRVGNLIISSGATLTLDGKVSGSNGRTMIIDGGFTNDGTVILDGNESIAYGSVNNNGTFLYHGRPGSQATVNLTRNFISGANYLTTFNNLVISEEASGPFESDSFTTDAPLTISRAFTLDVGAFTIGSGYTLFVQQLFNARAGTFTIGEDVSFSGEANISGAQATVVASSVTFTSLVNLNITAGSLDMLLGNIRAKSVNISGGALAAPGPGKSFAISGDFTHTAGTFTHDSGVVTFDASSDALATNQLISGDTSFFDLVKQVSATAAAGQTLTIAASATQTVGNYLTLTGGLDAAHLLQIRSSTGVAGNLNLVVNAGQTITNVDVQNNAATGLTLVGRDLSLASNGNTPNWVFRSATIIWDGSESTNWNTQRNWDLGVVPVPDDNVIITNDTTVLNQPVLTGNVSVGKLTLREPSATLRLEGSNLTVFNSISSSGTLANEGTIFLRGTELVSLVEPDANSGTFVYQGNNIATVKTITATGPNTFYNLIIRDANANKSDFTLNTDMTINGSLTVDGGTLTSSSFSMDIAGDFTLTSGAFLAPATGKSLFVGGNFTHTAGTFTHNNGTVVLDPESNAVVNSQLISGDTSFYSLVKVRPAGSALQYLNFAAAATQTVAGNLVLQGASTIEPLFINSDQPGVQGRVKLEVGGLQSIRGVYVENSWASGVTLVARDSVDHLTGYNNTNWIFGVPELRWDGSASSDWADPLNWDLGLTPIAGDKVVIRATDPLSATPSAGIIQPVLTALSGAVSPFTMTLESGTTLTLNGFGLTVQDVLTNYGNIIARGSEAIAITTADTLNGTFTYTGNNTGTSLLAAVNYHDLVLVDAGAPDTFSSQADLRVFGNLTLTSGILDVSAGSDSLSVDGNMLIAAGTSLEAVNGAIGLGGMITINGTLSAPTTNKSFTVGGGWSLDPAATFTPNNGQVSFVSANAATFYGNTTFWDFSLSSDITKDVNFQSGSTQTINNSLYMAGGVGDIILRSTTNNVPWTLNLAYMGAATPKTIVRKLDVKDSIATGAGGARVYLAAMNSKDQPVSQPTPLGGVSTNNPGWQFIDLLLITPADARIVGQWPVLIGQGVSQEAYSVEDKDGVVATGIADTRGYFRTEITRPLAVGSNTLTVYYGVTPGLPSGLTVQANINSDPAVDYGKYVPVISGPSTIDPLHGDLPWIWGKALPNTTVYAVTNSTTNDLSLPLNITDTAGSAVSSVTGDFSFALTKQLKRGSNYLSVVADGVSSALNVYELSDIYGYVFDSSTDNPIKGARVYLYKLDGASQRVPVVVGTDIASDQANPVITGVDGRYGFRIINFDTSVQYVMDVQETGFTFPTSIADNAQLPLGRSITTGSRGESLLLGAVLAQRVDLPVDANQYLFKVTKDANKAEARIGEVVTYTVTIENMSEQNTVKETRLNDIIPPGFKFMSGRVHFADGTPVENPTGNRPVVFKTGLFNQREIKIIKYQLVIGSGVAPGDYENTAFLKYDNGMLISNRAHETVKVVMDPLFDAGTVFGKVFWDLNENGRQDEPEYDYENRQEVIEGPVPNVHIVMEDGTSITADKNGQFHVPGLLAGRHVVMVDQRSLPKGAFLTTDKAQVIDVTPGMVIKVNFGVNMGNEQVVGEDVRFFDKNLKVDQSPDQLQPFLNADLFERELLLHLDAVIKPVEFRMFMNYAPFISSWKLDIVDKETKKLIREFNGTRYNINDPVFWDGRDFSGRFVCLDRKYSYMLKVQDDKGVWDETKEKALALRVLTDLEFEALGKKTPEEKDKEVEARAKEYHVWQLAQSALDNTDKCNIFVRGETLTIDPEETDIRQVRVLKSGELFIELPVPQRQVLTARGLLNGDIEKTRPLQVILPDGDYELEVVSADWEPGADGVAGSTARPLKGSSAPDTAALASASGVPAMDVNAVAKTARVSQYRRPVKVGDDYMTFVALGDGKMGYNVNRGNIEPVQSVDHYQPGFYQEGKMAYYLKGKVKGKYLVTSSFDTERKQKEMFRSIKDDQYYPVYGDSSTVNYDATNTQGNLYVMMEWDKSQAVWGNYAVDFNDTEFARYSRTLYGGKVDYTSVANNPYGDAKTRVATFHAEVRQRSAHNEFLGTGGSLYYLKHQGIVMGTAKVRLEVRDAVTGLVRSTTEMKDGVDYDIDNSEGRILFWQPVAMSADSGNIISNQLLQGDPVYVVADYEFEVKDKMLEATEGVRVAQAVGKSVVVGGTYVSETQAGGDYQLKGQDVTVHMGPDTKIKAEIATTTSQDSASYVSTDGGITFNELVVGNLASGKAYGISQDSRLFDRLGLKSYYKWIENNFATASTSSQQGKAISGLGMTFDLTPVTRLTANYDVQKLIQQGNLQTTMQVGAQETSTTVLQLAHDARRLRITSEFRHQEVTNKDPRYVSESNQVQNTLALQAEYDVDEKTRLTSKYQVDPTGQATKESQLTTALTRQLTDKLSATVAESFGTAGNSTKLGATLNVTPKLATTLEQSFGTAGNATRVGAVMNVTSAITASVDETFGTAGKASSFGAVANLTPNMALVGGYQTAQSPGGVTTQTRTTALLGKEQFGDKTNVQTNYSMTQTDNGPTKTVVGVNAGSEVNLDDAILKAGVRVLADDKTVSVLSQGAGIDASKTDKSGHTTSSSVKVDEVPAVGKVTTVTLGDKGPLAPGRDLAVERTFAYGASGEDRGDTYKVVQDKDGKKLETAYTRKLSDNQTQRSASNIFGLTGDVNDRIAANASLEQGNVQSIDGSIYTRTAIAGGFGYVEKDEDGKEKIKSSTKAELRIDRGDHDKQQVVLYQDAQGKLNDETTLSAKFQYAQTKDKELNKVEAQYKEIMLGTAYRPIMDDKLNLFAKYTYKENQGPEGQLNISDIEQTKMQVIAAEGAYDLTEDWQLVEKLAYRIMEEKVAGFEFTKTHTWLLVHRANYRISPDWKVGAEYRILTQREAQDSKTGFLVEAVRSLNDNVELGVGYNFTDFVDDLTNLSYTVQGPYIRMTGKLYDRTPEERARARQKWLDRRIDLYAWRMVNTEFTRKDSPVVLEMNALYRLAQAANQSGKYEESRKLYKDVILATQIMFEEAANFVRKHIAFEEKLYNAFQRAKEYYDKGELWAAKKLWEKIVEEAERSMLQ
ncbi:MAG: DUF11 domain-containing protein [Candidatus Omnitrophica bacterium]|nr:DUF11 domain-containing protein [Candidatus Omnitrophota bacterium]